MGDVILDDFFARACAELLHRMSASPEFGLRIRADADMYAGYLDRMLTGDARPAAARSAGRRYPAASEKEQWDGTDPARPAGVDGLQHAAEDRQPSLCGLPPEALVVYTHFFRPARMDACPDCAAALTSGAAAGSMNGSGEVGDSEDSWPAHWPGGANS